MDTTTSPPPIVAEPNRGDIQRAFAIFAETIVQHPQVLLSSGASSISMPLLGIKDLCVMSTGVLNFRDGDKDEHYLTADECRGVAAFFARMASLLEEPK